MMTLKFSCPKHRKYNPAVHGEAGIKGGCTTCTQMFALYRCFLALDPDHARPWLKPKENPHPREPLRL